MQIPKVMTHNIRKLIIGLCLICTLCGAKGCCTLNPTAFIMGADPDYIWYYRALGVSETIPTDSSLTINEMVSSFGYVTEYSFKVGEEALINCADPTGYSEWLPRTQNLTADLTSFPNTTLRLCIVGRGTDPCDVLKVQSYERANIYHWNLQRPMSSWSLTAPVGVINSLTTVATWAPSVNAADHRVYVSDSATCTNSIAEADQYSGNTATVSVTEEGSYFLCGEARDAVGNIKPASNNGLRFTVFTESEQVVMRDSITQGSPSSDMNVPIGNHSNPGLAPWYQLGVSKISTTSRTMLSSWSAHMDGSMPGFNGYTCGPNLDGFALHLRIWSSLDLAKENPGNGDVANLDLTEFTPKVRTPAGGLSLTGCPIELLEFDISPHAFIMEPNIEYYVAMDFSSLSGVGGVWGIMESDETNTPDWIIYDELDLTKSVAVIDATQFTESTTGVLAIRMSGATVP